MEDTAEKAILKEKAKEMIKKCQMVKNEGQQIRLILNVITPDNYDKKFGELRKFLFGESRTAEEVSDDGGKWTESMALKEEDIKEDLL